MNDKLAAVNQIHYNFIGVDLTGDFIGNMIYIIVDDLLKQTELFEVVVTIKKMSIKKTNILFQYDNLNVNIMADWNDDQNW